MEYHKQKNRFRFLKGYSWFIAVLSAVLVIGGTLSAVGLLPVNIWRGLDHFLTKMTEIFGFAALFLILFRTAWIAVKKLKFPKTRWIFNVWQFLKKRHVFFGWIVAVAGTAHSLYFLIFIPNDMNGVWSGLVAFVIMIVMVIVGYNLSQKGHKSRNLLSHTILGVIFMIGLLYHVIDLH